MAIHEFETFCDNLIKQAIRDKPKIKKGQDVYHETVLWVNDTMLALRKLFVGNSKQVSDSTIEKLDKIIDLKIKKFINRYL